METRFARRLPRRSSVRTCLNYAQTCKIEEIIMNEKTKCSLNILRDIFVEAVRKLPEEDRSGLIVLWDDQWDDLMESLNK